MKRDLPKRMYQHGLSYRIVLLDGTKVPLGRDLPTALSRYYIFMAQAGAEGSPATAPKMADVMWRRHRNGARQRGLAFTITPKDIEAALEAQGHVCAVTGLAFNEIKPDGLRIRPWAPSIDRLNGRVGYEPGNVRIVCGFVNIAMNGFGEHFFKLVLSPLIEAAVQADRWMAENG